MPAIAPFQDLAMYAYRYAAMYGCAVVGSRKSSSVVRKNAFETRGTGTTFSCRMCPNCLVSTQSPVTTSMAIELPS